MEVAGTPVEGEVPPSRGKSRQKIMKLKEEMNSQKFVPKTSNEVQADRIRQLKESYDLALLRAEELNRHPVSNLYQKVHGDRAKRVYSALSSLIFSTISFSKAKGLEDYIRQNAVTLPAAVIDLNEWEYVLQNVHDCREAMIVRSTPRAEIPFDLRKKMELCQYLATQPVRNTKDEIQILRQSVVEQLNEFYGQLHQSMNMVLYVVEQIKDLNRKDESLAKIRRLEEDVDTLQQEVIAERLNGQDKLKEAQQSYALEAERLNGIIKENTATYKRTKAETDKAHEEEVQTLRNQVEALTRDLMQADDKIRTRDRKLAGQAQVIQDLEETLARERAVTKRLKDLQEADIIAVTSSLTSDLVVSQAVNIATYFKEFREPDKVIQALRDFEAMKVDLQQLQTQHQTVKAERTTFAERVAGLEHDVDALQRQLTTTEATLAATRSEYAAEQARWLEEKQTLTSSWHQTQEQRETEASAAHQRQTALEAQVTQLSTELARVSQALETTTHENTSLKTHNETLHRENQELRIQILEKDNERIVALQHHMDALVSQQDALKAQLDRSNAEKDQRLQESLQQEDAKIGALQDFVGGLTHELDKMKDNMETIKQTNKREAEILATETDKVNALHVFAIDLTTQILDIKTTVDHLTHEKDIVLQLIKLGEIIRAEQEPRVVALRQQIDAVEQRVTQLQAQLATMHAGIDAEHLSESMKQQHHKLLTLSKNLDRLLWEITTLKTTVEEGILPHELEPNAALHAIKKLEAQLVAAQTKVFAAEDTATQWQTQHRDLLRTLHDKDTELATLTQQNTQHMTMLTQAAGQIQELIGVIEGETANALDLFHTIQGIEEELLSTQEKLNQSEAMALALTEQLRQVTARKQEMPVAEHEQIVVEMEAETQRWIDKATALEAALVKARATTVSPLTTVGVGSGGDSTPSNGAAGPARRRSVGFADNRNEVIMIQEAAGQATAVEATVVAGDEAAAAAATSAGVTATAAEAPVAVEETAAVAVPSPAAAPPTVVEDAAASAAAAVEVAPPVTESDEAPAAVAVAAVEDAATDETPPAVPEAVGAETAAAKATPAAEESVPPEVVETAAAPASARDEVAASASSLSTDEATAVPSLPLSATETVAAAAAAATTMISSARSVNSASSAGSVGSRSAHTRGGSMGGAGAMSATPRTAAHYVAQQQTLNVVKEAMIQLYSDPASKRTSATSSPRLRPSSATAAAAVAVAALTSTSNDDAPETAIEPAAAVDVSPLPSTTSAAAAAVVAADKDETDATAASGAVVTDEDTLPQHPQHGAAPIANINGGLALDEDFMVACPGTVQGETGWYLSHGQYFYFVLDATTHEFLLLCGPLSTALYEAARDEDALHPHGPSHGPSHSPPAAPSLQIDRMAVHATRFHLETLLQDVQERDEALIQLQGADDDNQTQQRDIGILLGKLAEYEQQIYALKQFIRSSGGGGGGGGGTGAAAPAAMVPGSALEGGGPSDTDIFSPPLSPSPVKLQRQATVEALDAMPLLLSDDGESGGGTSGSGSGGDAPSAKAATATTTTEAMTPEMAGAVQKLTSVARGFLARQRVHQLKLYRLAEETGVLVAMGNTKQGESGWYCGPNGQIFYFVLHNGQWIYAAGPIPGEEFRRLLKDALALQRKVTSGNGGGAASRAASIAEGSSSSGGGQTAAVPASPLLQKCPFVLSGIHGDLAESGEVYLNLETLRLHLSLNVEDLMVALQQNTLAGGGMVSGRAPSATIFEDVDDDGASTGGRSGGGGGGGGGEDENDGEWLMRQVNTAPGGGPDDAASASSMKQSSAKKTGGGLGGGVVGGGSVESSVLSINDDSVDSFEDTAAGSVRAGGLSAKAAAL